MNIETIIKELNLKLRSATGDLKKNISGGYTGDLLSDVMANSHEGDIWITRQVHQNIVAVASLKDHAGIILINSCEPAKDTLERAAQENIPIMVSDLSAFELSGKVYDLLAKKD
ncbi:MAG: DRTGG domain protein [Smithella sp. PtaU1.Bin162]|nr:MAG: DRTGG domain protein [Smithella sp. PtaU1.Bin162]